MVNQSLLTLGNPLEIPTAFLDNPNRMISHRLARLIEHGHPLRLFRGWAWLTALLLGMLLPGFVALSAPSGVTGAATDTKAAEKRDTPAQAPKNPLPGGTLEAHERAGGHLLSRHVGKTEEQLRQRLKSDTRISAASSFTDRESADIAVKAAIAANQPRILNWQKGDEDRLVFSYRQNSPCGLSLSRGASKAREAKALRLVLVRDPKFTGGWRILTGYPEL